MADGTRIDEHGLTAAHPSLSLKMRVKVTNLANGATVNVTVTDRGPGYGRGIDLSEAAAEALRMRRCGLANAPVVAGQ
ncbi:MAG: RlpA-like protein precursor [Rhodospirillales bacterium]|nr:RlpA-like protein precursor [Rhodospirillales bacterium]